jgi:hypothetical protein
VTATSEEMTMSKTYKKNLAGRQFGMLTCLEFVPGPHESAEWLCRCECGATRVLVGCQIVSGMHKSCGCLVYRRRPIAERFEEMTCPEPNTGCLLWTGHHSRSGGYGHISLGGRGRQRLASRVAYEMAHGSIPAGMCVCHKCDTPACVNVSHLFLGTPKDNSDDKLRKRNAKMTLAGIENVFASSAAGERQRDIAARHGVSQRTIGNILRGERYARVS